MVQSPGRQSGTIDTTFDIVAYDGLDMTGAVLGTAPGNLPQLMIGDTVWNWYQVQYSGSGSAAIVSVGDPCVKSDTSAAGAPLGGSPFPPQHCWKATIRVSLSFALQTQTGTVGPAVINGFVLDTIAALQYARTAGKLR